MIIVSGFFLKFIWKSSRIPMGTYARKNARNRHMYGSVLNGNAAATGAIALCTSASGRSLWKYAIITRGSIVEENRRAEQTRRAKI